MAMVYDNLKGSFKEGKATDESKNQSGLMAKELSALSNAGQRVIHLHILHQKKKSYYKKLLVKKL